MLLPVKKLDPEATLPTRGSVDAAGLDLYALGATRISSGARVAVPTGIILALPHGTFGALSIRSGHARKHGLVLANGIGVIDADFRGQVMAIVHNTGKKPYVVEHGERFAQLVIQEYVHTDVVEVDELDETVRAGGGFGSTGQ